MWLTRIGSPHSWLCLLVMWLFAKGFWLDCACVPYETKSFVLLHKMFFKCADNFTHLHQHNLLKCKPYSVIILDFIDFMHFCSNIMLHKIFLLSAVLLLRTGSGVFWIKIKLLKWYIFTYRGMAGFLRFMFCKIYAALKCDAPISICVRFCETCMDPRQKVVVYFQFGGLWQQSAKSIPHTFIILDIVK